MNLRAQSIPEQREALAALCKASGDELRLNVLRALANDSFGVLELAQIFDVGQSGMSHHLKVLAQAELVATRREGNAIFYRRALPDSLRLGLDSTVTGGVVGDDGRVVPGLYAVGPPRKGTLWESTAVPEIRTQAAEVAREVTAAALAVLA